MRKTLLGILFGTLFAATPIIAQTSLKDGIKTFKGQDVICPGIDHDHFSIIKAPEGIASARKLRGQASVKNSTFIVNYVGFPEEAKSAFQRAVDILETLVYSSVPIRVTASWEALGNNILGSANTSQFMMNFEGAKYFNTYYPIALAEKLAGKPLNSDNEDDIYCRFNSSMRWHYGEPETIASGFFDFTTIVLHELGHGLGFISTMSVSGQNGSYGYGTPHKSIYDVYIENSEGRNLIDTTAFSNNSAGLRTALTSNSLFFDKQVNSERPRLFAPATFEAGSSISHLDDNTYFSGTTNALMTSTARSREVTHNPGPLALGMFYEMGWKNTSISHLGLKNFAANTPVTFKAKILSDTTIKAGTAKLFYQIAGAEFQSVDLVNTPGTTEYTARITFPPGTSSVSYYFTVEDNFGSLVRAPGMNGVNNDINVYNFQFGNDTTPPVVYHTPYAVEELNLSKNFMVLAEDDFEEGLDKVVINYQVNGGSLQSANLEKYNEAIHGPEFSQGVNNDYLYLIQNLFPNLRAGDVVKYQIVATDKSANKTVMPTEFTSTSRNAPSVESFYEFTVTSLLASRNSYGTDFENSDNDFALLGFGISQANGFNSKALHSSHPYKNGLLSWNPDYMSLEYVRNEIAMLRYPVTLGMGKNTLISFDEVVLVEPGEGDEYYDMVITEGSYDGLTWFPLEDGYDSRANTLWENLYNQNQSSGDYPNSTATGMAVYTKKRNILLNTGVFGSETGRLMLIRFRLESDQLVNGWGWSIDNLYIQDDVPVILSNEQTPDSGLKLYPNPSTDYVDVNLKLAGPDKVHIEIFSIGGGKVYNEFVQSDTSEFNHKISVAALSSGNYVLKIKEAKGAVYKRFTKI